MKRAISKLSLLIFLSVFVLACNYGKNGSNKEGTLNSGTVAERLNGVWVSADVPDYELKITGHRWITSIKGTLIENVEFSINDSCNYFRDVKSNDNGKYITVFHDTTDHSVKPYFPIEFGTETYC